MREKAMMRVVVGVDDSLAGLQALREAVRVARARGARLLAVRATSAPPATYSAWAPGAQWPPRCPGGPAPWELCERQAEDYVRHAFAEALGGTPRDIRLDMAAVFRRPYRALVDSAMEGDVLVVGASRRWRRRPFRRSVGAYCTRHAACPVLVVPPHEAARRLDGRGPLGWLRRRQELAGLMAVHP